MARKSVKSSITASVAKSTAKRAAADKATPTRQSKRVKATPTKSSYFEPATDEEEEPSSGPGTGAEEASDYEDDGGEEAVSESDHEHLASDDDVKPKRAANHAALAMRKKDGNEKELWKPGAKLPPGTQLIIKKPKAREDGGIPYADSEIHPNTLLFLKELAANNDRTWLKMHDPDFRAANQDFTTFLAVLTEKIIESDETIPELPVKDIIFRIYRDMRFTNNPLPYKAHFSAAWSRTGRKGPYACYYVQIKADGGSFVGGGLWQPSADALSKLRRDIDRKPHKLKRVLMDATFQKAFLGGIANSENKAIKAFTNQSENKESALKKHPKGYDSDHKDIELLRLRNFTIGRELSDDEVVGAGGLERIADLIASMVPFITYLNSVVMPDDEDSSDSSEDGDDDEEGGAHDDEDGVDDSEA